MACRLFGTKPLPKLIVNWTPRNKFQWNLNQSFVIFIQENAFENVCQIGSRFVQGLGGDELKNSVSWFMETWKEDYSQ